LQGGELGIDRVECNL